MWRTIIILSFVILNTSTYCQELFNNTFDNGVSDHDAFYDVYDSNFGYYVIGSSSTSISTFQNSLFAKIDEDGSLIWIKNYNIVNNGNEILSAIVEREDYLYLFGSIGYSNNEFDAFMLKTNMDGDSTFSVIIDNGSNNVVEDVLKYKDGFLLLGYNYNGAGIGNSSSITLTYVDTLGNIILEEQFGQTNYFFAFDFKKTVDEGYIICGTKDDSPSSILNDVYLLKVDSNLVIQWDNSIGDINNDYVGFTNVIEITDDNNYVVVGMEDLSFPDYSQGIILIVDSLGNLESSNPIVLMDYTETSSLRLWSDGSIIVVGGTVDYSTPGSLFSEPRGYIQKRTSDGQTVIWNRFFSKWWDEKPNQDYVSDLMIENETNFVVSGYQIHDTTSKNDGWMISFDSCGYMISDFPDPLFIIDSIVNRTVYLNNLSTNYCTANYDLGDGNNKGVYAYSSYTNGEDPQYLTYTYADTGQYEITLTALAGDNSRSYSQIVSLTDLALPITKHDRYGWLNTYPNPSTSTCNISYYIDKFDKSSNVSVNMHNLMGEKMFSERLINKEAIIQINMIAMPAGIYILSLEVDDSVQESRKIVKL